MFNLFDTKIEKKIAKIIERVEALEAGLVYMQRIKVLANDVHYVSIPKREVLNPAGLKEGDWVKVQLIKMEMKEVNKL